MTQNRNHTCLQLTWSGYTAERREKWIFINQQKNRDSKEHGNIRSRGNRLARAQNVACLTNKFTKTCKQVRCWATGRAGKIAGRSILCELTSKRDAFPSIIFAQFQLAGFNDNYLRTMTSATFKKVTGCSSEFADAVELKIMHKIRRESWNQTAEDTFILP